MFSEGDRLTHLLDGSHRPSDPIQPIIDPAPPVVDPDSPLDGLADIFLSSNAAVVVDHGAVAGIVTNIDVIDHLAKQLGRELPSLPSLPGLHGLPSLQALSGQHTDW